MTESEYDWTPTDDEAAQEAADDRFTKVDDANRCQCEMSDTHPCQNAFTGEDYRCPTCRNGCRVLKRRGYPAIHTAAIGGLRPAKKGTTARLRRDTRRALTRETENRSWDTEKQFGGEGGQPAGLQRFRTDSSGIELAWDPQDEA